MIKSFFIALIFTCIKAHGLKLKMMKAEITFGNNMNGGKQKVKGYVDLFGDRGILLGTCEPIVYKEVLSDLKNIMFYQLFQNGYIIPMERIENDEPLLDEDEKGVFLQVAVSNQFIRGFIIEIQLLSMEESEERKVQQEWARLFEQIVVQDQEFTLDFDQQWQMVKSASEPLMGETKKMCEKEKEKKTDL